MKFIIIVAAGLALLTASSRAQEGLTLNYASNPGGGIQFNGAADSFSFNNGTNGWQWSVTSEVGGTSAIGLNALISGSPFSYGPITSSGSVQYATVLAPLGSWVMSDGSANLTGTVNWIDVATYGSGVVNGSVEIDLSNIQYSGSNPDLQYLVANVPGSMGLNFQFSTTESLTQLSTGSEPYVSAYYAGSIWLDPPPPPFPEPSTLALAGLGGMLLIRWKRKANNGPRTIEQNAEILKPEGTFYTPR